MPRPWASASDPQICRAKRMARASSSKTAVIQVTSTSFSVQTTAPTFVEVKGEWMPGAGAEQSSVELLDGTGARMTLRVRGDVSTLLALAQSFWRRRQ